MAGSPPPPPLFEIRSLATPAVTVFAANYNDVNFGKTVNINNSGFNVKRANGTVGFQVLPLGNLTLNTDGFTTANRGFFINSDNRNFFKVTETELKFSDATQELFKVDNQGYAYARKMVVTLNNPFPDYVFEKNYKLMPLSELKLFIATNKHLPNMASAKEVSLNNNQVEIGELTTKLLEKVEELTLYILQQQAEIDALKAK